MTSTLSPFERTFIETVLALKSCWMAPQWHRMSHCHERVLNRLVRLGMVEARLPVAICVAGEAHTFWLRVAGRFDAPLARTISDVLAFMDVSEQGQLSSATKVLQGRYERVRLTSDGETIRQDFLGPNYAGEVITGMTFEDDGSVSYQTRPGIDYRLFTFLTGWPNEDEGFESDGVVELESGLDQGNEIADIVTGSKVPSWADQMYEQRDASRAAARTPALEASESHFYEAATEAGDEQRLLPCLEIHPDSVGTQAQRTWQEIRRKAEEFVRETGGKWPGRNRLAKLLDCSGSLLTKAVSRSSYLQARKAEFEAGQKTSRRPSQLCGEPSDSKSLDPGDRAAADEQLAALISEQQAEKQREERQARAADRRGHV